MEWITFLKIILSSGFIFAFVPSVKCGFIVQCYVPNWSITNGHIQISDINPNGNCDVIVYAFFKVSQNLLAPPDNKYPAHFAQLRQLKERNRDLKIHLSVGGWTNSQEFSMMTSSLPNRTIFVTSVTSALRKLGADGLDVDWEYPENSEKSNYILLLKELRAAFDNDAHNSGRSHLALTAAVGNTVRSSYNVTEMSRYLDIVNVMSYDYYGFWEPHHQTGHNAAIPDVHRSMLEYLKAGVPAQSLSMGIPFYGRSWTLEEPYIPKPGLNSSRKATGHGLPGLVTKTVGVLSYPEICAHLRDGWASDRDLTADVPYIHSGDQWVSYDDPSSIRDKVIWAGKSGLNGVFIWHLAQDDIDGTCGKPSPLLNAVSDALTELNIVPTVVNPKSSSSVSSKSFFTLITFLMMCILFSN